MFHRIELPEPRKLYHILHGLKEKNPYLEGLLYAMHASRICQSDNWLTYCLTHGIVLARRKLLVSVQYQTCELKHISRQEATQLPKALDLTPTEGGGNKFYGLRVLCRILGEPMSLTAPDIGPPHVPDEPAKRMNHVGEALKVYARALPEYAEVLINDLRPEKRSQSSKGKESKNCSTKKSHSKRERK